VEKAILGVSAVAALAAIAAVAIPLWQGRAKAALYFTAGYGSGPGTLSFDVRFENLGRDAIYRVKLLATIGDSPSSVVGQFPIVQPGSSDDVWIALGRPEQAELPNPGTRVDFRVPVVVEARYGWHRKKIRQPVGPFAW